MCVLNFRINCSLFELAILAKTYYWLLKCSKESADQAAGLCFIFPVGIICTLHSFLMNIWTIRKKKHPWNILFGKLFQGVLFWHINESTYYVNLFNGLLIFVHTNTLTFWDQREGAKNEKWNILVWHIFFVRIIVHTIIPSPWWYCWVNSHE